MRIFFVIIIPIALILSGCSKPFWKRTTDITSVTERESSVKEKPLKRDPVQTRRPDTLQAVLSGRVKSVNDRARFVIINFPVGRMPQIGQLMWVYREGQRVGRIKITGPQVDLNIAADIVEGEIQNEDEVRVE